ncbi:MAG: hypothetical protein WA840_21990 [Caulobacteraceae bacterium]
MTDKAPLFGLGAVSIAILAFFVLHLSKASADMQPRLTDQNCEDHSESVSSPDGRYSARYTKEACDYGFGSNSQNAWVNLVSTQSHDGLKVQVLQLQGPNDDLDVVNWRDNSHLEIDVNWPLSVKRSLHKVGPVQVIYVASVSRPSLARGADYARFVDWARRNAEHGQVSIASTCSRYKGGLLRQPC